MNFVGGFGRAFWRLGFCCSFWWARGVLRRLWGLLWGGFLVFFWGKSFLFLCFFETITNLNSKLTCGPISFLCNLSRRAKLLLSGQCFLGFRGLFLALSGKEHAADAPLLTPFLWQEIFFLLYFWNVYFLKKSFLDDTQKLIRLIKTKFLDLECSLFVIGASGKWLDSEKPVCRRRKYFLFCKNLKISCHFFQKNF